MALALLAPVTTTPAAAPPPAIVVTASAPPDAVPMEDAVAACDRATMAQLAKAEPHRRARFAAGVYAEQRAIAAERAALPAIATTPTGKAALDNARATLDARQKRLDDTKLTEQAWRSAVDEMRGDFLANCQGKHD